MPARIENYGFIGDLHGAALVSRDGSIDWLCLPRFDSDACLTALLGRDEHGCWSVHPGTAVHKTERRYRPGTMILETDFYCDTGVVRITDFMPVGPGYPPSVVRIIEGLSGSVPVDVLLTVRFGYGQSRPWIVPSDGGIQLTVAPDSLILRTPAHLEIHEHDLRGIVTVKQGQRVPLVLSWHAASLPAAPAFDALTALADTERWWQEWSGRSQIQGTYKDVVDRSLITLKAMIYAPTGGIVAAPTAGLPEELGGERNWDYRFCWLRDATLTLEALMAGGYVEEATAWRDWLLRAIAGAPEEMQIMYGIEGERRLTEFEVPWLPGYEQSQPVRIGNAASEQFQLDIYGEVMKALYEARQMNMPTEPGGSVSLEQGMEFVDTAWQRPDDGIWEVRGGRKHFVHSKVMAWVAADRFARMLEAYGDGAAAGLSDRVAWARALADRIHRDICEHGFNTRLGAFTQSYGSEALDAAVLMIPIVGFLPADDPRVQGTVRAIEEKLMIDGFVRRYLTGATDDGLKGSEGVFLPCSFWLADNYAYAGEWDKAEALFEKLLAVRNDLGLLSEEYDTRAERLIGNFPQAFSHLALIRTAGILSAPRA